MQSRSERQRYTSDRIMPTATEPADLKSPWARPYLAARIRSALRAPAPKATSHWLERGGLEDGAIPGELQPHSH